jgi:Ca-activated chloride channel homolog
MQFAQPHFLWLTAVALPLLAAFLAWSWRRRQTLRTQFIQTRLLDRLTTRFSPRRELTRLVLIFAAITALFLSLARPQWGYTWEEARQRGLDIIVAIDTSRSMLAEDLQPNRLARAKLAALDLLRLARTDRLGLVAFSGTAFLQCPLTLDDHAFRQSVEALDTRIIPQGGTALAAAIHTALAASKDEDNFKVLVLISDGEDHEPDALAAAAKAASAGLRIFTLGVGTPAGEVLRYTTDDGRTEYIKDPEGNVVKSRLNEVLLQQIATTAHGFYLPLAAPRALETLYAQGLAPLPKTDISSRRTRRYHERYHWPLTLALLMLSIEATLPHARRERSASAAAQTPLPSLTPPAAQQPLPKTARPTHTNALRSALLLLPALLFPNALASPATALKLYEAGRYAEAQQLYRQLLDQNPNDPRLHFNLGTAAYRAGDLEQALRSFTNSLTAPDLRLQQKSFYNLGNALYQLGETAEPTPAKSQLWKNAARSFEAALKLNPQDADSQNNLDYVRRRLEELDLQPEPQPDDSQPDPDSDEQSDSQDQPPSQPQPAPQEPSESQTAESQPQPQPDDSDTQTPHDQTDPTPPPSPQPDPATPEEQDATSPPGEQSPQPEPTDTNAADHAPTPGEMTPEQAQQLLDAQKGNERTMIFLPRQTNQPPARIFKDW